MTPVALDEARRAGRLLAAQAGAAALFRAVDEQGILRPGVLESDASEAIRALAADRFGVSRHWHKRLVRSGPNTLRPYSERAPDRALTHDDIAFVDLGPVFEGWEADFGRTWVLGDDPDKLRLRDDLAAVFAAGKQRYEEHLELTAEDLHAEVARLAAERGWTLGGHHCGHLVGEFPHERFDGARLGSYLAPGNDQPIRRTDPSGRIAHWILEIHLVDRDRQIGGFYEELLTLSSPPAGPCRWAPGKPCR